MHTGRYVGEAIDMSDKAANKAMSAAFKYAHLMVFQIPTHGQSDDTENENIPVAPPRQGQALPPPPQQAAPPPPVQTDPMAAQIANGSALPVAGPGPAKATRGPNKPKPAAAAAPPPPAADPFPVDSSPPSDPLLGRIGETNTFGVLYAIAQEADGTTDPAARTELFVAIQNRAVLLFAEAKTPAEVKEGFPIVTALGQPEQLKRAANEAHMRFRQ